MKTMIENANRIREIEEESNLQRMNESLERLRKVTDASASMFDQMLKAQARNLVER